MSFHPGHGGDILPPTHRTDAKRRPADIEIDCSDGDRTPLVSPIVMADGEFEALTQICAIELPPVMPRVMSHKATRRSFVSSSNHSVSAHADRVSALLPGASTSPPVASVECVELDNATVSSPSSERCALLDDAGVWRCSVSIGTLTAVFAFVYCNP